MVLGKLAGLDLAWKIINFKKERDQKRVDKIMTGLIGDVTLEPDKVLEDEHTASVTTTEGSYTFKSPMMGVYLQNDGADDIQYRFNRKIDTTTSTKLVSGSSYAQSMPTPVFKIVYYKALTSSATLYIRGLRGYDPTKNESNYYSG